MAAFCILATSSAFAQMPTAESLAKVVDTHYNRLKSLRARYTERFQGMGMDRSESGVLTLRKPGKMRWSYDHPAGKIFLLDGHDAISYIPGDAQAQRIPAKQLDDMRSPLRFLLGHTELRKELDHLTLSVAGSDYILAGSPRGLSQRVRSLAVTVDGNGQIHALKLQEIDGVTTTFTFTGIEENVATQDSDFHFEPPPGVAVVNGPPAV